MSAEREEDESLWKGARAVFSNHIERGELKPGDHIYSWRLYLYSHHGIYVGDGMVIHFTNAGGEIGSGTIFSSSSSVGRRGATPCGNDDCQRSESGVIKSCLDCFLSGGKLYRFEYAASKVAFQLKVRGMCTKVPSDSPEEVVGRAVQLLEKGFGTYNLFKRNCEDFAIYCKTSLLVDPRDVVFGQSSQLRRTLAAAASLVPPLAMTGAGVATVAVVLRVCSATYFGSDIGSRSKKVSVDELEAMNSVLQ